MTQPQLDANGLPPLTDPGNGLISEVRCHLVIGKLPTPDGERGVATIRAGNATLTLVLGKAEAEDWAKVFAELARSLSGSALVIPQRGQAMQIAGQIRNQGGGALCRTGTAMSRATARAGLYVRIFGGHDGVSGCGFYRMTVPLAELGRHDGFEVTFADAGDRHGPPSITLSMVRGHDVIVAQRWNTHKGLEVWRRARTPYSRLVYDLDDDLWNITPENWKAYHLYGDGVIRDAVEHHIEVADLVTVSTEPLAEVVRQFNPNVAVLPNCVPESALCPEGERELPRTVGWAGAASHGEDIAEVIAQPLRRFLRRFPHWRLQLHGTDYRDTVRGRGKDAEQLKRRMAFRPWIQVNDDPQAYYESVDFGIGLCPLYPTTFARSKSFVKALEYGARGIPVIASDIEPYRPYIEHGVNGFLVRRDHEWLKYMSELAADSGLRAKMGEANRVMAARCTIERNWERWAEAYSGLFRRPGRT